MVIRLPLTKSETSIDKKKLSDASTLVPNAKAEAKVKVKANAVAAKASAGVLLTKETAEEESHSDKANES